MTAVENKRLMQHAFAELERGNSKPFVDLIADDMVWITPGSTSWSGRYAGKGVIMNEMWGALRLQLEGRIRTIADRITADGDIVVVEAHGDNMTKRGQPYRNTYCMVYRFAGGKIKEMTEYMDTDLVAKVLAPPQFPSGKDARTA